MIKVIGIENIELWDETVKSFADWDVYYLNGYVRAFQLHGDGEPLLFLYSDGETRAINVVFKRDIAMDAKFENLISKGKYFDSATPYGYGGWLIEGNNTAKLDKEYTEFCKNSGIVSEFVRYSPVVKNADGARAFYDVVDYSKTIAIDTRDSETIWKNFESRNRTCVRHAQNEGVVVKNGNSAELYDRFIELYNATMARDNATDYYFFQNEFYDSVRRDLKDNSTLFYAEYKGEIVAASIIMFANKHVHYHLSASNRDYQSLSPTNLLLYEVALWAAKQGYKYFHLGGGVGGAEDNLFRFKSVFNRHADFTFCLGKKIFDKETYNLLVETRNSSKEFDTESAFFPLYRS